MLSSLFLSFREGLEAALVIGIILVHLTKINRKDLKSTVYFGAIAGLAVSLIGGFIGFNESKEMEEASEEIFEGIMMFVASGLIAYFILWLHRNNNVTKSVKDQINKRTSAIGLFILAFLSVFREGIELVIFNLTQVSQDAMTVATGSILGIALAVIVTIILFKTTVKFNLSILFKALGVVLIFLGGEMFAEGLEMIFGGGEALEIIGLFVFILPSLYILLKDEVSKIRNLKKAS
ncbi:FTR1 family iron permease [Neobacillus sp. D3-1R]|uniref:FTR1 family iron permease n=1 Tax=Neobacillus sp. D3-1R TaxID=3445778 RepID=UPI003FA0AB6F